MGTFFYLLQCVLKEYCQGEYIIKTRKIPYGEKKYLIMRKKEGNIMIFANRYNVNEKRFHIVRKKRRRFYEY